MAEGALMRLQEAGFTDAMGEKRLADALASGVIFGLSWNGQVTSIDQKSRLDDPSVSWWNSQKWSDAEKRSFRDWLKYKLKATEHQVILGASGPEDEFNGISDLSKQEREQWYRINVFNDPSSILWPTDGLYLSDAVMAFRTDAKERSPEEDENDLGMLLERLKHGSLFASGEPNKPGRKRVLIPIIEFEVLQLDWKREIISDLLNLTYYDVRIHQPDRLPPHFETKVKDHLGRYRARNKLNDGALSRTIGAEPQDIKLSWGVKEWILHALNCEPSWKSKILTDPSHVGFNAFQNYFMPWFNEDGKRKGAKPLGLRSFQNAARKPLT